MVAAHLKNIYRKVKLLHSPAKKKSPMAKDSSLLQQQYKSVFILIYATMRNDQCSIQNSVSFSVQQNLCEIGVIEFLHNPPFFNIGMSGKPL